MSAIVYIPNHADLAQARLPTQYVDKPNITALVRIFGDRAQGLENVLYDLISSGGVVSGHDSLLDQIGDVVGQLRNGLSDADYKLRLFAKIGQNVSKGTPEDVIRIFKLLMQADRVYYNPLFPAAFSLTAIGGTPLGTMTDIKNAMNSSRIGGVSIDLFASAGSIAFSFSDDPDPNGQGFGDYNDGTVGGVLAQVL